MLTIAIPTYNYALKNLVTNLIDQAKHLTIDWELLIYDDASTEFISENKNLAALPNVKLHYGNINKGRTQARQLLATKAKYQNLLFLDSDTLPSHEKFLLNYEEILLSEKCQVFFGGIVYHQKKPINEVLRWNYGRHREAKKAKDRIQNPYYVISQNLLIDKTVFLKCNNHLENSYGLDNLFSFELKKNNITPKHIDNPVFHLGLETNAIFLEKSLKAVETLVNFEVAKKLPSNFTKLQQTYVKLHKWKLIGFFKFWFKIFKKSVHKNLLSKKPNLRLFDLYRLYHYCNLKNG